MSGKIRSLSIYLFLVNIRRSPLSSLYIYRNIYICICMRRYILVCVPSSWFQVFFNFISLPISPTSTAQVAVCCVLFVCTRCPLLLRVPSSTPCVCRRRRCRATYPRTSHSAAPVRKPRGIDDNNNSRSSNCSWTCVKYKLRKRTLADKAFTDR